MPPEFQTKDSGQRQQWASGMQRDVQVGKPRFALMWTKRQPYHEQMLTRYAKLLARGAEKYEDRNWEEGCGQEELDYAMESLGRHTAQLICGETDEDHAAGVWFNTQLIEYIRWRMAQETEHLDGILAYGGPMAHFVMEKSGRVHQYVDPASRGTLTPDRIREIARNDQARVDEWAQLAGAKIKDYDGFRDIDTYRQITRSHFLDKVNLCTVEFDKDAPAYDVAIVKAMNAAFNQPDSAVDGAFEIQ